MPQKRHTVDQIVAKLRKADVALGKGKKVPEICKLLETQLLETQLLEIHVARNHRTDVLPVASKSTVA